MLSAVKRIAAAVAIAAFAAAGFAGIGMYHHTSPPGPVATGDMHVHG